MNKKQVALIVLCAVLGTSQAAAAGAPHYNMRGTWVFDFMHIPFAKLWVAVDENEETYKLTAGFKSTGIVGMFKSTRSLSQSKGIRTSDGKLQALWFQHDNKERGKHIMLRYNESGDLTERNVVPEDDPWHRPRIAPEEVAGIASPGDMLFILRDTLRSLSQTNGSQKKVRFYEGKRLMEVSITYIGAHSMKIDGKLTATHKLQLARNFINGYSEKEIRRYNKGEPEVFLYVRQSDLFPVAMQAKLPYGTMHAKWVRD